MSYLIVHLGGIVGFLWVFWFLVILILRLYKTQLQKNQRPQHIRTGTLNLIKEKIRNSLEIIGKERTFWTGPQKNRY